MRENCTADFEVVVVEKNELHLEVLIWDLPNLMIAAVNYCQGWLSLFSDIIWDKGLIESN